MFHRRDKPHLIEVATELTVTGLVALAVAMNGAIPLVMDLLFEPATVIATVACMASLFAWLWFGIALVRRLSGERSG